MNPATENQLCISNLPLLITEKSLLQELAKYGRVVKINLKVSKNESRIAFVEYKEASDAESCRKDLNGKEVLGQELLVARAVEKRDPRCNIFIKPVPAEATVQDLESHFETFGKINSSMLEKAKETEEIHAFILFDTPAAAEAAVKARDESKWGEFTITVNLFQSLAERCEQSKYTNLYVRGYPVDYTAEMLYEKFSEFGTIVSHVLNTKKMFDGVERSFGYVSYETHEEAKLAESLNGVSENGFVWMVIPHLSKKVRNAKRVKEINETEEDWKERNVYIGNLDKSITEEQLTAFCSKFGRVESVKIPVNYNIEIDQHNQSRRISVPKGMGYVMFKTSEEAQKAVNQIKEEHLVGKTLYAAKWKPKNEIMQTKKNMSNKKNMLSRNMNPMMMNPMMGTPMMGGPVMGGSMMGGSMMGDSMMGGPMMGGPMMGGSMMSIAEPANAINRSGINPMPLNVGRNPMVPQMMGMGMGIQMMNPQMMNPQMMNPQMMRTGMNPLMMNPQMMNPMMVNPMVNTQIPERPPIQNMDRNNSATANSVVTSNSEADAQRAKERRQEQGEKIYPEVVKLSNEKVAGLITGMLLEFPQGEILKLINNEEALRNRVEEAMTVLRESWKNDPVKLQDLDYNGS